MSTPVDQLITKTLTALKGLSSGSAQVIQGHTDALLSAATTFPNQKTHIGDRLADERFPEIAYQILNQSTPKEVFCSNNFNATATSVLDTLLVYCSASDKLAQAVSRTDVLNSLVGYIQNYRFSTTLAAQLVTTVVERSLDVLLCLSSVSGCRKNVKLADARQVLSPLVGSSSENYKLRALLILVQLAVKDDDIDVYVEEHKLISLLVQSIQKCMSTNARKHCGITSYMYVRCLTRIATVKSNAMKVLESGVSPHLVRMLKSSSIPDQMAALQLYWTLAFESSARTKIRNTSDCMQAIEQLADSDQKQVKQCAGGALWELYDKGGKKSDDVSIVKKQVYISYVREDEKKCFNIKKRIEDDGHTVILSTAMAGIKAMDAAVQSSNVTLMLVSEHYKFNLMSHTECKHIMSLHKKFGHVRVTLYNIEGYMEDIFGSADAFDLSTDFKFLMQSDKVVECVKRASETVGGGGGAVPEQLMRDLFNHVMGNMLLGHLKRAFNIDSDSDDDDGDVGSLKGGLSDSEVRNFITMVHRDLSGRSDYTTSQASKLIKWIGDVADTYPDSSKWEDTLIQIRFHELSSKIISQLFGGGDINHKARYRAIMRMLETLFNFTDKSKKFAKHLAETGVVSKLNSACLLNSAFKNDLDNKHVGSAVLSTLGVIYNISQQSDAVLSLRKDNTVQALLPYIKDSHDQRRIIAVLALAAILDDAERAKKIDPDAVELVVTFAKKAVTESRRGFCGFKLPELIKGLVFLIVCDKKKAKFLECGGLSVLESMMSSSSVDEQRTAAEALQTLAQDKTSRGQIKQNPGCLGKLTRLAHDSSDPGVQHYAKNALSAIQEKHAQGFRVAPSGSTSSRSSSRSNSESSAAASWTNQQVQQWLDSHGLSTLKSAMSNYDGAELLNLRDMEQKVPTMFYNSMQSDLKLNVLQINKLVTALKSL